MCLDSIHVLKYRKKYGEPSIVMLKSIRRRTKDGFLSHFYVEIPFVKHLAHHGTEHYMCQAVKWYMICSKSLGVNLTQIELMVQSEVTVKLVFKK